MHQNCHLLYSGKVCELSDQNQCLCREKVSLFSSLKPHSSKKTIYKTQILLHVKIKREGHFFFIKFYYLFITYFTCPICTSCSFHCNDTYNNSSGFPIHAVLKINTLFAVEHLKTEQCKRSINLYTYRDRMGWLSKVQLLVLQWKRAYACFYIILRKSHTAELNKIK